MIGEVHLAPHHHRPLIQQCERLGIRHGIDGEQRKYQVGGSGAGASAGNALSLHRGAGIAQPGCVHQDDRIAAEIEMHLDRITRRAGLRRDDGNLPVSQGIDQARLSGIGRADDSDGQPIPQPLSSARIREVFSDSGMQKAQLSGQLGDRVAYILIGEFDVGFQMGAQADDLRAPAVIECAQAAADLCQSLPPLRFCLGGGEVGNGLSLGQV